MLLSVALASFLALFSNSTRVSRMFSYPSTCYFSDKRLFYIKNLYHFREDIHKEVADYCKEAAITHHCTKTVNSTSTASRPRFKSTKNIGDKKQKVPTSTSGHFDPTLVLYVLREGHLHRPALSFNSLLQL